MNKEIDTAKISEHRNELLGLATILIFIIHLPAIVLRNYTLPVVLLVGGKWLLKAGVDIFLFLSGMGLYCSLLKRPDIRGFYRKRAEKTLASLLIVLILWVIVKKQSFAEAVKSITLLDFWIDGVTITWYFALLVPLYALFPLLFRAVNSGKLKFPVAVAASLALNLALHICVPDFYNNTGLALTRVPVFLCGVYCSHRMFALKKPMKLPRCWLYICLAFVLAAWVYIGILHSPIPENGLTYLCRYIINYGGLAKRYILLPFSLSLLVLFSCLKAESGFFPRSLATIGQYSMEVYLVQERVQMLIAPLLKETPAHINTLLFDLISLLLTIGAALGLKALSRLALKAVKRIKKNDRTEGISR